MHSRLKTFGVFIFNTKITGEMPGSRGLLPAPSPLRTLRETFASQGSSIDKASCDTQQSETAFTIRGCIRGTFQVRTAVSNIAVTIIHTSTVIPFKSFHVIQHRVRSLLTFTCDLRVMIGQILNPYLTHYRTAFAFSDSPLPASP